MRDSPGSVPRSAPPSPTLSDEAADRHVVSLSDESAGFDGLTETSYPSRRQASAIGATMAGPIPRRHAGSLLSAIVLISCICIRTASAVLVPFSNCLADGYIASSVNSSQVQLQWIPLYFDAVYDSQNPTHGLQMRVWGNVTGRVGTGALPAASNKTYWQDHSGNPNTIDGKIVSQPEIYMENGIPAGQDGPKNTTLHTKVDVVTYSPFVSDLDFCGNLQNGSCPLPPVFNQTPIASPYDGQLPSFGISNEFGSSYAFTSFNPTFIIRYGDQNVTSVGCVSAVLTPDLGGVSWFLKLLPAFVLLLVAFATSFAAIFSPWGTSDVFHWTSNWGRDPDILRLVTPGFGDCLQYIQFIVLTGGLTLNYPGFYQPIVSQGSWSVLMFNQSFVSDAGPWQSLVDGLYVTNGTYGLENIAQLDGISQDQDIWAGMMIWLLVILAITLVTIQIGFFSRWLFRYIHHTPAEDLRAKNLPFSMGMVIRIVFNYFLLPIVTLSTFQLVIAGQSKTVLVAMAAVTLALIIGFAAWLMYIIASSKDRSQLFDDLSTLLLYGPLYNTYSDGAATFALIPLILTFVRGIALGAVQPSGVAQLVVLAICEVIQILSVHAFHPFHSPTSMNAYHTAFSALRFCTVVLMISFIPSMGVGEGPKGWIGYAILFIHGSVLVFGFFLNSLQTIIEVIARLLGAGGDDVRGQTRGGLSAIFGARQLSRRVSRREGPSRQSQLSTAAMLDAETTSRSGYGRVRSESAGSMGIMLNQPRNSSALDARSVDAYSNPVGGAFTPTTPGEASTFSFLPSSAPGQATRPQAAADPYYRPPRPRRETLDGPSSSPAPRDRNSFASVDMTNRRTSQAAMSYRDVSDLEMQASGRVTPAPASYAPVFAPRADYSTREVDFYYGVRGPALNSDAPNRRLGTGPADPTSPVATATGWLKGIFGGKTKEKGKGFEVVRSARMPPAMKARGGDFAEDNPPEGIPVAMGVLRNGPIESDDEDMPTPTKGKSKTGSGVLLNENGEPRGDDDGDFELSRSPPEPPLLPGIDMGEKFPSRLPSKASKYGEAVTTTDDFPLPAKSIKRNSNGDRVGRPQFSLHPPSEASQSRENFYRVDGEHSQSQGAPSARLPFDRSNSQKRNSAVSLAPTEDFNQLPPAIGIAHGGEERPASFGYVSQHNISRIDPEQRPDLLGSAAEVIDDPRRASPGPA